MKTSTLEIFYQNLVDEWNLVSDQILKPKERLGLTDWSEQNIRLTTRTSSRPGMFSVFNEPYQQEILDSISRSDNPKTVVVGASQMVKSTLIINFCLWVICNDPGPILIIQPDNKTAREFLASRIIPLIEDNPEIKKLCTRITAERIDFVGGYIVCASANSPSQLSSKPIKYLLVDELSRYSDTTKEGDPFELASKRQTTFGRWAKTIIVSSPHELEDKIWDHYRKGTQKIREIPCPHCETYHQLQWENYKFDSHCFECPACKKLYTPAEKNIQQRKGRWVSSNPDGEYESFHINILHSSMADMSILESEWLDAQSDIDRLKVFLNTRLAKPWVPETKSGEEMLMCRQTESNLKLLGGTATASNPIRLTMWFCMVRPIHQSGQYGQTSEG